MAHVENKPMNDTKTIAKKILDFLVGFLGSLTLGNIAIVLIGQFVMPDRMGVTLFVIWVWRLACAGLAVFFFTKKRFWISIGLVAAILLSF